MARKPRNYKAEYQRRIQRGRERGLNKSVSRGHPKKGFIGIKRAAELGVSTDLELNRRLIEREEGRDSATEFLELIKSLGMRRVYVTPLRNEMEDRKGHAFKNGGIPKYIFAARDRYTDQQEWIKYTTAQGRLTEREAYTLWFSP